METAVHMDTDIGEGFGVWGRTDDGPLLDTVSAANIACGFHAGDPDILRETTAMAAARGVSIGAQVSYNDLAGFGRRFIDVEVSRLVNDIVYQIGALQAFARIAGSEVAYVKAHGALYNVAADHVGHARAIVDAVKLVDPTLPILCQFDTEVWSMAAGAGIPTIAEVFVDRNYTSSARLVSRRHPAALITDAEAAADRALTMVHTGAVESVDGVVVRVLPASYDAVALCVHSDTAGAVEIATHTRKALANDGFDLTPIGRRA
ncbi:5-oxoprolinase subunit PxpA [Rhodococcus sp. IEGM 1381]|nr:5-oxoprolinase subunit PxpA [Rhodococcus sp. IEGM 1381]MDI9897446.1 5-oxoprolinase subunit PxpA [Rhodococcus sp. IEGM 1381]